MAILGKKTLNTIQLYQLDADPSTVAGGFDAPIGSPAFVDGNSIYQKLDQTNVSDWERFDKGISRKYIYQTAHGFVLGNVVYWTGTAYALAIANVVAQTWAVFLVIEAPTANSFVIANYGYVTGGAGLSVGSMYYLSDSSAGNITTVSPTANVAIPIFYATDAASGFIRISYSDPASYQEVSASAATTTTSTTDVQMNLMTITPLSGKYFVLFSSTGSNSGAFSNTVTLYVNGVAQTDTVRVTNFTKSTGNANNSTGDFPINKIVTVAGGQAIEIRWKVSGGTGTMNGRTLSILKIG